jgi:hypothetical protein
MEGEPDALGSPAFRFAKSSLAEDQPDPNRSPGSQAIQSVLDDLGDAWIDAWDFADLGSQSLELFEAGDVRLVNGLPDLHGQEQAAEGILRRLREGLRHGLTSQTRIKAAARATCPRPLASCIIPDGSSGCVGGYPATLRRLRRFI